MSNCEIELGLSWSKECIISEITIIRGIPGNPDANLPVPVVAAIQITGATFQINNVKLYVPVVTLSINHNIHFLENIKQRFKRTISWKKYISEIKTQTKNNHLAYLIDPTFRNVNKLFVISFKNDNDDPTRDFFNAYYMPLVEIKDFDALIDNKPFFEQPVKKNKKRMKNL